MAMKATVAALDPARRMSSKVGAKALPPCLLFPGTFRLQKRPRTLTTAQTSITSYSLPVPFQTTGNERRVLCHRERLIRRRRYTQRRVERRGIDETLHNIFPRETVHTRLFRPLIEL